MKPTALLCAAQMITFLVSGTDIKYPVNQIPTALLENTNAVIRKDEAKFTIHSRSHATFYTHEVITILNSNAERYSVKVIGYDKLSKVNFFNAAVYDNDGNLIKKLKGNEIYDQSAFDGFTLFSDNRIKAAKLSYGKYPYTVEFEYEIDYRYTFAIPAFYIIPDEKISVERSVFTLAFPSHLRPFYRTYNLDQEPKTSASDANEELSWTFTDVLPVKFDPMGPRREELLPKILSAPSQFEYDGYIGANDSWDSFGRWISDLNRGRDRLSQETIQEVNFLIANQSSVEAKTKTLYHYLQRKTRYVSIQLGIGGFQPFEAKIVDQYGYGDCKALSNYMVALLSVAGIESYYTLIRAGASAPDFKEDFPSTQFNHAVVFVPIEKDTLWLECTSQTNPFGYMGTFTGDRKALAITKNGAKIVQTPKYPAEVNLQTRSGVITLSENGSAHGMFKTRYQGLKYETDQLNFILEGQFDKQKKWLEKNLSLAMFNINKFEIENIPDRIPTAIVYLDLTLDKLASTSGKRLFLNPNVLSRYSETSPTSENRKTDVFIPQSYIDQDTIDFDLPESFYPEYLPETIKHSSEFGEYQAEYFLHQNRLRYIRKFKVKGGRYPSSAYKEWLEFQRAVKKYDNTRLVFQNKT